MIFRRYGTSFQSVDLDFDAKALNEFGFRRNRVQSIPVEEFESKYVTVEAHELAEEADGPVQSETEQAMLDKLQAKLEGLLNDLGEGHVLVVENEQGHDYPKPRQQMKNVVEEGENRLHFEYSMSPALRVSVRKPVG